LVIRPQWVRKSQDKILVKCHRCQGSGTDRENLRGKLISSNFGADLYQCSHCQGKGNEEVLPKIPPPPEFEEKFLNDLREWVQSYEG